MKASMLFLVSSLSVALCEEGAKRHLSKKTLGLESEIRADLERAEKRIDKYYEAVKESERKGVVLGEETMRKMKKEIGTTLTDFLEAIQMKMSTNMAIIEEDLKEKLKGMQPRGENYGEDFKESFNEFVDLAREQRRSMGDAMVKKHEIMKYALDNIRE
ncbi:MAG: uncharacterized protein A8A55_1328 [Amphiamblys sp. WSBS2006]|nr:MAG: uncharacterized protein A8A55_1328 [Amphiamblys sp. WSBS2006]